MKRQKITLLVCGMALAFVLGIAGLFFAQWRDTDALLQYAEAVFAGDIPVDEADSTSLRSYNWRGRYDNLGDNPRADFELERRFVLHNFSDGNIWVRYTIRVYDSNNELVFGSARVPSLWKIHKTVDGWEVVLVIEEESP